MNRVMRTVACALSTGLAAGTVVLASGGTAFAAGNGHLLEPISVTPSSGSNLSRPTFGFANGCPAGTNSFSAIMTGPGGWTGQTVLGTTSAVPSSGGTTQLDNTWQGLADANPGTSYSAGLYTVSFRCQDSFDTPTGDGGDALVYFSSPTAWQAVQSVATTTALTVSPATATAGQTVTLTATVTASSGTPAGSVQFKDGASNLGSAVALSSGSASMTKSDFAVGSHSITAVFTPSNAAPPANQYQPSTSPAKPLSVGKDTSPTTVAVNPAGTKYTTTPLTLSCAVPGTASGGAATGTVTFTYASNGGTPTTTSPIALSGGTASYPAGQQAAGTFSASCAYSGDGKYDPSTSSTATESITDSLPPEQVATEYLRTTVNAGTLTIVVQGYTAPSPTAQDGPPAGSPAYPYAPGAATNVVILPNADVNSAGTLIETSGNILPVVVTDTRAGDPGYHVTGKLTDFVGTNPSNTINAANLGWTPAFIHSNRVPGATTAAAASLVDGGAVAPGNGLLPGAPDGGLGLAVDKTLYTAPAGHGTGTVFYGANVHLQAPTTTKPDTYTATLTLSAIATP